MAADPTSEFLSALLRYIAIAAPSEIADELLIRFRSKRRIVLPVPLVQPPQPVTLPLPPTSPPQPPEPPAFNPTDFQCEILGELDGRALKADALAAALHCDRSRLYKPGGLNELKSAGQVQHSPGRGYYRPDAPPEGLNEAG